MAGIGGDGSRSGGREMVVVGDDGFYDGKRECKMMQGQGGCELEV